LIIGSPDRFGAPSIAPRYFDAFLSVCCPLLIATGPP
jgi:hypothetical protein